MKQGVLKKSIVYVITNKTDCSGCHACLATCPKNCISMVSDDEGFWYPNVDEAKCVQCGLCVEKCPIINEVQKGENPIAYAALNKDLDTRLSSSSGGVFSLLAEYVIDCGGTVFGAAFDENLDVYHVGIDKKEDIKRLQGSKYVQSKIGDCYKKAKKLLDEGSAVLFSGTPCQTAGLQSYLGKIHDNLFTVDIVCHGVPSPKVWGKYLEFYEKTLKSDIKNIAFRHKKFGWKRFAIEIEPVNGKKVYFTLDKDLFLQAFLRDNCLRPSCHSCNFKGIHRHSDITLADFWGISNVLPDMDDDQGTSLILVHSKQAEDILTSLADKLLMKQVEVDQALKYNSAALHSVKPHPKRKNFLSAIDHIPFDEVVKKYCKISFSRRVYGKLRGVLLKVKHIIVNRVK